MIYILSGSVIFLFLSILWLKEQQDTLEASMLKAVKELERKIALSELEQKNTLIEELEREWKRLNELACQDDLDDEELEKFEIEIESIDKKIAALEESKASLIWAKRY